MELFFLIGTVIALDLLASGFGYDSQEGRPLRHHDLALDAIRNGDVATYRMEMDRLERDIARGMWRRF